MTKKHLFWLNLLTAILLAAFVLANFPLPKGQAVTPKSQPGAAALPSYFHHLSR